MIQNLTIRGKTDGFGCQLNAVFSAIAFCEHDPNYVYVHTPFYSVSHGWGWEKDEENKKIDKAIGFANTRHQGAWHKYAEEKGLDNATKDDYYLQMNVEMGSWSDNPVKYKKKIKRAIGEITPIKEALKEVN